MGRRFPMTRFEILRRFAPQNDILLSERTVGDACPYNGILSVA